MNRETRRAFYRYRPFIFPSIIIVGTISLFFFVIVPFTQHTIDSYQQVNQAQEQLEVMKNRLSILERIDERQLETLLTGAVSAISIEKSLPAVVRTIETIANESNLIIDSLTFDSINTLASESGKMFTVEEREVGSYRIPFTVTTSSGFKELSTFLEKTVTVRRFVRARSFNLNFGADDESSTQIMFDAFYLPLQSGNTTRPLIVLNFAEEQLLRKVQSMPDASNLAIAEDFTYQSIGTGSLRNPFQ